MVSNAESRDLRKMKVSIIMHALCKLNLLQRKSKSEGVHTMQKRASFCTAAADRNNVMTGNAEGERCGGEV
jgi:hypothetical protein